MSEQTANSQDPDRTSWQPSPPTAHAVSIGATEIRTTAKYVCPGCGERIENHPDICPACGEDLVHAPKQIRCMHCHTSASSELVLCPGCGRELREAPPKAVTLGVPALLALLLMALVVSQWGRVSPISWARSNLVRGVILVEDISASIEPEMVIVMTPIVEQFAGAHDGEGSNDGLVDSGLVLGAAESIIVSDTQAVAMKAAESVVTPLPMSPPASSDEQNDAGQENSPTSVLAENATHEPSIGIGGPSASELAASSVMMQDAEPTALPVATAAPEQPTPEPTVEAAAAQGMAATVSTAESPPTPTWTAQVSTEGGAATATATPEAVVELAATSTPASEAVGGMARVSALAASEGTPSADSPSAETASGAPTRVPPTATPAGVTAPLPTATPLVYQVRTGDTLVTIAARYEVEVEELMEANNISAQDVFVLQPGQMLYIPGPVTPSESAVEPVVSVASLSATVRLEAPTLVVPPDNAMIGCATGGKLIWQRVQFVKDSDKYVLHLGFVNGKTSDGQEDVVWILAQSGPVTQTEWELDSSLCDLAPDSQDHQWRWWVEVVEEVDGRSVPVSPPSPIRGFVWN